MPRSSSSLIKIITTAIEARTDIFDAEHEGAFRLFNGFYEGFPELTIDLYGRTLILFDYSDPPHAGETKIKLVAQSIQELLPWLRSRRWVAVLLMPSGICTGGGRHANAAGRARSVQANTAWMGR